MRTRRFELLRPREIVAERDSCPIIYLPVGPLEWHGWHLPLGTDAVWAHEVALRASATSGGVVLPPLYWGCDEPLKPDTVAALGLQRDERIVGLDLPGNPLTSHYCLVEVFGLLIRERLDWVAANGYRIAVIVNGHGGGNQVRTTGRLAAEYTRTTGLTVLCGWPSPVDEHGKLHWTHAGSEEVSLWMILSPESVDLSELPEEGQPLHCGEHTIVDLETFSGKPTPDGSPRDDPRTGASVEYGERQMNLAARQLADMVTAAL